MHSRHSSTLEQDGQFLVCWWYLSSSCSRERCGAGVASRPSCRQYPLWPCLWNHLRHASTLLQYHHPKLSPGAQQFPNKAEQSSDQCHTQDKASKKDPSGQASSPVCLCREKVVLSPCGSEAVPLLGILTGLHIV